MLLKLNQIWFEPLSLELKVGSNGISPFVSTDEVDDGHTDVSIPVDVSTPTTHAMKTSAKLGIVKPNPNNALHIGLATATEPNFVDKVLQHDG